MPVLVLMLILRLYILILNCMFVQNAYAVHAVLLCLSLCFRDGVILFGCGVDIQHLALVRS